MALPIEQAHALFGAPGLTYSVSAWIRADVVGYVVNGAGINDATSTLIQLSTTPSGASAASATSTGDIIQVANEDMLVVAEDKTFGLVYVTREYANTTFGTPSYPYNTAAWTWKNFTSRVANSERSIDAITSIKRAFEKKLNKYESSVATLRAWNLDRFWDTQEPPTGISSYRQRWLRLYLHTHRGQSVDTRRLATMLIDSVETDDGPYAYIKLKGLGSMLQNESEASSVRQGREWYTYIPTFALVQALLEQTDYGRQGGEGILAGLPLNIKRQLSSKAARTIPVSSATVSHWGKVSDFLMPPGSSISYGYFKRSISSPLQWGGIEGGYPSAMCWDPTVTGVGNVVTGSTDTVGRLYVGIGSDLWEFDPVTSECKIVVTNAGSGMRIRRLWYNTLDTVTGGKPKILGAAWADYMDSVDSTSFVRRAVSGRLFHWTGGTSITTSSTISTMFPGTHCFRDGSFPNGTGPNYRIGGRFWTTNGNGENLALPFEQTFDVIYAGFPATFGSIRQYDSATDSAGNAVPYRAKTIISGSYAMTLSPGVIAEAVDADGDPIALNKSYFAVGSLSGSRMNFRFTMGQQGACELIGDSSGVAGWCDRGAIAYCDIDTTSGIISVKAWEPASGTTTTLKTFAQTYEQPISMAGNGCRTSAGAVLFLGYMEWNETGDSTGFIKAFDFTPTESSVYSGASDGAAAGSYYYSPIWMTTVPKSTTAPHLVVTWFKRDAVGSTSMFGYKAYQTFPFTKAEPQITSSILHAVTTERGAFDSAYALDTAGRFLSIALNPSTSAMTLTVLDRGFAPVDGETWSATSQLAQGASSGGQITHYGISSPAWPFGNDVRNGKADGQYVLWKHDKAMWDNFEIGYFEDETIEEALGHVAFGSMSVWGFDWDGGGNFRWDDRVQSSAYVVQYGGLSDRVSRISRRRAYDEIENPVEITPWVLRSGEIKARVDLTPQSTISSSSEPIDVQSPDNKQKFIVLTCVQAGRVGMAKFKAYVQGGTYKTILTQTYPAGVATGVVQILFNGRSASGPWNESTAADRNRQLQLPASSRIILPDGATRVLNTTPFTEVGDFALQLNLATTWTPSVNIYAGSPVEIDLEVSYQSSDYVVTTSDPDGTYVLTSSFDWQEIGAGKAWTTGCLIRFREPQDRRDNSGVGVDVNYGESSWSFGDRIVIDVPGIEASPNSNSKIKAFDADAMRKYGNKPMTTDMGKLSARKAERIANARLALNKDPRWIYTVRTFLSPHVKLFDVVRVYSPKIIRTSPYYEDVTVRRIEHDLKDAVTVLECIGGAAT